MFARIRQQGTATVLRRNIGMTLGRQVLAALAQFLLVVVIARQLGPEGNGFYAMAILVPTLMANFLNLGVGPATVYHVSRGDYSPRQAMAGNLKLAGWVSALGLLVAVPILILWSDTLFPGIPPLLLYLGLAGFPLTLLVAYLNTVLQGMEDFRAYNVTILLPPYINLIAVVVALYGLKIGVEGAMVAYITGQLAGVVAATISLARKAHRTARTGAPMGRYGRTMLSYGWKAHLSNIVTFVNYRADIFLVNLLLSPASTGVYVIAVQIAERLWMLSQAASAVLLPRLSAMRDNPEGRLALTNKGALAVTLATALISILAAAALYVLVEPVFGVEYREAVPAFLWLLPGIVAWAGARVQSNCIAAAGKPEWNMYSALVVVTVNLTGNALLIPDHGIVGAAWATSLAYLIDAMIKFCLIRKTRHIVN
ncbi:flippase [Alloalcanivorax marinus]|uniref:flippase n=1 Tax=Alloalcanivorax marinus TaxID=1177169 RepID=UPI0021D26605|nr:flippase [Alloalcanivorax marinus]